MKKVALFYGGLGNEAEISILSARNIFTHIDLNRYAIVPIFRGKDGKFYHTNDIVEKPQGKEIQIGEFSQYFDIAFLITHGKYGEDGILQAVLETQGISYCGCKVMSSALCMDKAFFKQICANAHIPQLPFTLLMDNFDNNVQLVQEWLDRYGAPLFLKPANSGSSIGINKIEHIKEFEGAYFEAKKYDHKLILEKGIPNPREIEVGIIGNTEILISPPGELVLQKNFYDYQDKYHKGETKIQIPAQLSSDTEKKITTYAKQAYKLFECSGFARIDFFIGDEQIYLNEINTLPGFTSISMFPMLMQATGLTYTQVISKIIELAKD